MLTLGVCVKVSEHMQVLEYATHDLCELSPTWHHAELCHVYMNQCLLLCSDEESYLTDATIDVRILSNYNPHTYDYPHHVWE